MPDYKKMYLGLFAAVEDAIEILINAQQKAEETFVETAEAEDTEAEQE